MKSRNAIVGNTTVTKNTSNSKLQKKKKKKKNLVNKPPTVHLTSRHRLCWLGQPALDRSPRTAQSVPQDRLRARAPRPLDHSQQSSASRAASSRPTRPAPVRASSSPVQSTAHVGGTSPSWRRRRAFAVLRCLRRP